MSLTLSDWVAVANLVVAVVAILVAIRALSVARQTMKDAQHMMKASEEVWNQQKEDWRQQKWFDLYFKADQAYNAWEHYQTVYQDFNPDELSEEQQKQHNHLMHVIRELHTMVGVFPKNNATDALVVSTQFGGDPYSHLAELLSKDRLNALLDALELLREKALVNENVLVGEG